MQGARTSSASSSRRSNAGREPDPMLELYSYFRSSAAYRVRIALSLKGLDYRVIPVHLLRHGGEQFGEEYRRRNPEWLVDVVAEGVRILTQSMAISKYLEETHGPAVLLARDAPGRARVSALALHVAC